MGQLTFFQSINEDLRVWRRILREISRESTFTGVSAKLLKGECVY